MTSRLWMGNPRARTRPTTSTEPVSGGGWYLEPEHIVAFFHDYSTTGDCLHEVAERWGFSEPLAFDIADQPEIDGDEALDRLTVSGDATVLRARSGAGASCFHLPNADDPEMPVCGKKSTYREKDRSVLPWDECCKDCARKAVIRGPYITPGDIQIDDT